MSAEALQAIERAHAILAWMATIALVLAALASLRPGPARRGLRAAGASASALLLITAALGALLDEGYRGRLRQRLFLASPALGWLFERKLHLAFGAVLLALSGLAAHLAQRGAPGEDARSRSLAQTVALAFTASALLALFASIASALVARRAMF